jgi:hypothetical protein
MNQLPKIWSEALKKLPETEKGSQNVIFFLESGERVKETVYNFENTEFDRMSEIDYIIVLSK